MFFGLISVYRYCPELKVNITIIGHLYLTTILTKCPSNSQFNQKTKTFVTMGYYYFNNQSEFDLCLKSNQMTTLIPILVIIIIFI